MITKNEQEETTVATQLSLQELYVSQQEGNYLEMYVIYKQFIWTPEFARIENMTQI